MINLEQLTHVAHAIHEKSQREWFIGSKERSACLIREEIEREPLLTASDIDTLSRIAAVHERALNREYHPGGGSSYEDFFPLELRCMDAACAGDVEEVLRICRVCIQCFPAGTVEFQLVLADLCSFLFTDNVREVRRALARMALGHYDMFRRGRSSADLVGSSFAADLFERSEAPVLAELPVHVALEVCEKDQDPIWVGILERAIETGLPPALQDAAAAVIR